MKRRIIILAGSFVAILLVFIICLMLTAAPGRKAGKAARDQGKEALPAPAASVPRGVLEPIEGTDLYAPQRDRDGRLRALFQAPRYDKQPDGSYLLDRPRCTLYQTDGRQLVVRSNEGVIYVSSIRSEEGGGKFTVRRGKLTGNVRIYYDQNTQPDRTPVEIRTDDVVRISTEELELDNENLVLFTNGTVKVDSPQAELRGQGLAIRWNEDPQELRSLRLEHGDYLAIYNVPEEAELFGLPGGQGTTRPVTESQPASEPASVPVETSRPTSEPAKAVTTTTSSSAPVATGPAGGRKSQRKAQNIFRAEFVGNVTVDQGQRFIHGADKLALEFQWERKMGKARPTTSQSAEIASAGPPKREGTPPADEHAIDVPSSQPGGTPNAVQRVLEPASKPTGIPMMVKWTGPVVIVPAGYTETPSPRNIAVSGAGGKVTLSDKSAVAVCKEFYYNRSGDEGFLKGGGGEMTELTLSSGEKIICPEIHFNLTGGQSCLVGAGRITRPSDQAIVNIARGETATAPAGGTDTISWDDQVLATIVRYRAAGAEGRTERIGAYIKEATFLGNVLLTQSASGDNMQCDRLQVWTGKTDDDKQVLQRALARGAVQARQREQEIKADNLDVTFRQAASGRPADNRQRMRTEVKAMLAYGNVTVTGLDANKPWLASADRLEADPGNQMAVFYGNHLQPASVEQAGQSISGPEMHFDGGRGSVLVAGAGQMRLIVDKDFSGQVLSPPRPATVNWSRQMTYEENPAGDVELNQPVANFIGDVRFVLGQDELTGASNTAGMTEAVKDANSPSDREDMTCRSMKVTFVKADKSGKAGAAAPSADSPQPSRRPSGGFLADRSFGRGLLWKVEADEDVVLKSRRFDEQRHLSGWAEVHCPKMIYDANAKTVDNFGKGWLFVQDLRAPKEEMDANAPRPLTGGGEPNADEFAGGIDRPSQTYFEWTRAMRVSMKDRKVTMNGDVWMRHLSGSRIIDRQGLEQSWNTPAWPERLPAGRANDLVCDSLEARFSEPNTPVPTKARGVPGSDQADSGLRLVGSLESFDAMGSVLLTDENWEVVGEQLSFIRKGQREMFTVLGSRPGHPEADARIVRKNPDTITVSPLIQINRSGQNMEIKTGRMGGSGVIYDNRKRK